MINEAANEPSANFKIQVHANLLFLPGSPMRKFLYAVPKMKMALYQGATEP
jgi:hypothetical protein